MSTITNKYKHKQEKQTTPQFRYARAAGVSFAARCFACAHRCDRSLAALVPVLRLTLQLLERVVVGGRSGVDV